MFARPSNQIGPPATCLTPISGLVHDDPQQPGTPERPQAETPQSVVRLDEGLLRRVLGFGRFTENQVGSPKGDLLIAPDQFRVCVWVTLPGLLDETALLQRPSLPACRCYRIYTARLRLVPNPVIIPSAAW